MIPLKDSQALAKMKRAGSLLAALFDEVPSVIKEGSTTASIDTWISKWLAKYQLVSKTRGYHGYRHVSCVSINDEVVHGVPRSTRILAAGDLVKVDVCASWLGYSADMARCFFVSNIRTAGAEKLVDIAWQALNKGIDKARVGNHLSDISAAIQEHVESNGFGVVRDFAGHGIGERMHEEPEILNYGAPGKGPLLKEGMAFALEPMITAGNYEVYVASDRWTVKTKDGSLAAHVEDTVVITGNGPEIITRS